MRQSPIVADALQQVVNATATSLLQHLPAIVHGRFNTCLQNGHLRPWSVLQIPLELVAGNIFIIAVLSKYLVAPSSNGSRRSLSNSGSRRMQSILQ